MLFNTIKEDSVKKNFLPTALLFFNAIVLPIAPDDSSSVQRNSKIFNTCHIPAITPLFSFPFGQKSDELKIQCVQEGFCLMELISLKLPIDRDDIGRMIFSPIALCDFLNASTIKMLTEMMSPFLDSKTIKEFTVIPKLLYFKGKINSIIGIELCLPEKEQELLKIARIALFFIQNITKNNPDIQTSCLGFNRLAIYNADNLYNKMIIFGETDENKNEIRLLIESLFKDLAKTYTAALSHTFLNIIQSELASLATSAIGLIIEESNRVPRLLAEYNALENITSTLLIDDHYLIYNPINQDALALVNSIQKNSMPLNQNYYLYGSVIGYDEEDIALKYQLEAYLKSIGDINSDGTIRWPYNIPKWLKKNKEAFDAWIESTWNAHSYFFYPKKRRRYEYDKKKAQKYLKHLRS